ncbi:hypothetical protein G3N56_02210 [Desulfovibrio sulfodismutans]|uniref:Uncharacterized protein n=1 Tax=Desulfolutivibrio sulfodismutans TaxID=63561 RepID=A0A7K3NK11_9BACT|nr:hypothetical protein [Desulfolutivibrio sulfodismutans]NDY55559.1 hypothetical protein [Desulfolutivibrio sulfodismutans]
MPVPPPYYGGYYGPSSGSVAAGIAIGAMLTVLPATAIAISNSANQTIYRDGGQCFLETYDGGAKVYKAIPCP